MSPWFYWKSDCQRLNNDKIFLTNIVILHKLGVYMRTDTQEMFSKEQMKGNRR